MLENVRGIIKDVRRLLREHLDLKIDPGATFTVEDIVDALLGASMETTSIEDCNRDKRNKPSPDDVFYHLHKLGWREMEQGLAEVNRVLQEQARARRLFEAPAVLALDYHDKMYHGKRHPWISGTKPKDGTCWAYRMATIDIVEPGRRFTLESMVVKPFMFTEQVVKHLVRQAREQVKVSLLLLDRGFFSVEVIRALQELGVRFIMPAVRNREIARLLREARGDSSMDYRFGGKNGVDIRLVFYYDQEEDEMVVFATNIMDWDSKSIAEAYRSRWGIETGYRVKKDFLALTTSPSPVVRYLFLFLSVVLYNAWVLANRLVCMVKNIDSSRPVITAKRMRRLFRAMRFSRMDTATGSTG